MYIANIRITFKTAPHDEISHLTILEPDRHKLCERFLLQKNINEVVIVQTCNRFEVYFAGKGAPKGETQARKVMLDWFGASTAKYMVMDSYLNTVAHLLEMASSLDSMIVGESQILAQVKEAYDYSLKHDHSGKILKLAFQKAISVGKKVRTETGISDGKVSISSVAVDHAHQYIPLKDKKIVILGTGKMASLVAEYLPSFKPKNLIVIGRTPENLEKFCKKYFGKPLSFDYLAKELEDADVVFSATACPNVLITRDMIKEILKRRKKPIIIIDIAMPEDVDPAIGELDNVAYFCIDDLQEISKKNMVIRHNEAIKAQEIIKGEIKRFRKTLQNSHIDHLISSLNNYTDEIRQREVNKSLKMLGEVDEKIQVIVDGLSKSIMKKTMHNFIQSLKSNPSSADDVEKLINLFTSNGNGNNNKKAEKVDHEDVSRYSDEAATK